VVEGVKEVVLWGEMMKVVLWRELVLFLVDHVPAFADDLQMTSRV